MAARRPPYDPDPFTFMIESVDATDKLIEPLSGCINMHGAVAALNALVAVNRLTKPPDRDNFCGSTVMLLV